MCLNFCLRQMFIRLVTRQQMMYITHAYIMYVTLQAYSVNSEYGVFSKFNCIVFPHRLVQITLLIISFRTK